MKDTTLDYLIKSGPDPSGKSASFEIIFIIATVIFLHSDGTDNIADSGDEAYKENDLDELRWPKVGQWQ